MPSMEVHQGHFNSAAKNASEVVPPTSLSLFWSLLVAQRPWWPVGSTFRTGFLLVFCCNHCPKMHSCWARGMQQTDRRTDRS